jgi:hypothetical protein
MLSLFIVPLCSRADFGDFSGDSDYSWDDDDYSYSWDDDDDDDYGWYDNDYDHDRYSYNRNNNDYSHSSSPNLTYKLLFIILYFVPMIVVFALLTNSKRSKAKKRQIPQQRPTQELFPMDAYRNIDPNFSEEEMKQKIEEMYIHFQHSWQAKDISDLRSSLTDAFYAQIDRQLDNYRTKHQTNCIEDIDVTAVELKGWRREGGNIAIIAHVSANIIDYVIDDISGDTVRGNSTDRKFMRYEWTLVCPETKKVLNMNYCPNCGAKLDVNFSGVCEYCGSHITAQGSDWAVSNIKGISQRTKKK